MPRRASFIFFSLTALIAVSLFLSLKNSRVFFFPQYEYAHIRLRVFVEGTEIDVGNNPNGTRLFQGACSAVLQKEPLATILKDPHSIRLMWKGVKLQDVFTYLGLRDTDFFGYVFSPSFGVKKIPLEAKSIIVAPEATPRFLFIRTGEGYIEREISDWFGKSIEDVFGRSSQIRLSWYTPNIASAHEEEGEINTSSTDPLVILQEQEEARRLNNVLGEGVLFIQHSRPENDQIQRAFDTFPLLSGSLCDEAS